MGVARGAHISMGLMVSALPGRSAIWALRAGYVGALVFALFLLFAGTEHVLTVQGFGQVSSAMRMPMWIVYLCLPLGAAVFLLRVMEALLRTFLRERDDDVQGDDLAWRGGT